MTYSVVVRRAALDDIDRAAVWYERRRADLGRRFVAEIDRVVASIVERPEACPVWKEAYPYRRAGAHRFPYLVFYEVDGDRIVVVAVAHAKQRPGYWLGRRAR